MKKNVQTTVKSDLVIVTGYSGAGKSSVLRALEDLGYSCIDNLPPDLFDYFSHYAGQAQMQGKKVALGIDVRAGSSMITKIADQLLYAQDPLNCKIIFLTCSTTVLYKRFQETRRKHPLVDPLDLTQAIEQEKMLLKPLQARADVVIDTDHLNIHELRRLVRTTLASGSDYTLMASFISFGFKYGVPLESNFVYDLRTLPNPFFVPELKHLDGKSGQVQQFLFSRPEVLSFYQRIEEFCHFSFERAFAEGHSFITVAIGCTGGRHRSVAFVEKLAQVPFKNSIIIAKHRDSEKDVSSYDPMSPEKIINP